MKEKSGYDKIVSDLKAENSIREAGLILRVTALVIDFVVLYFILMLLGTDFFPEESGAIGINLDSTGSLVFFFYYLFLEWSPLQGTLGKVLLQLKVCDGYYGKISFGQSILRCFGRIVTFLTLFLGFLTIIFRDDKRALHDIMSGTVVITKS